MSDNHVHSEISRLRSQVAALEQLLDVHEQTTLEQADRLEHALQFREKAEEELKEERNTLREIVSQQQQLIETIRELSAPLLPVHDRILVLPLIGHIDSTRSAQIMESLLMGVQRYQARFVIVDITGVPVVDTSVANHLIQAARATSLLGARCMLVGIAPEVAQTLVQLGVDLSGLATRADLQAGIAYALAAQ